MLVDQIDNKLQSFDPNIFSLQFVNLRQANLWPNRHLNQCRFGLMSHPGHQNQNLNNLYNLHMNYRYYMWSYYCW